MGFRDYDPGLNRFLTRDMYNGALEDMRLTLDPWNMNRYAFAGGNPITMVELDGHLLDAGGGTAGGSLYEDEDPVGYALNQYRRVEKILAYEGDDQNEWIDWKVNDLEERYGKNVAKEFQKALLGYLWASTPHSAFGDAANAHMNLAAAATGVFTKLAGGLIARSAKPISFNGTNATLYSITTKSGFTYESLVGSQGQVLRVSAKLEKQFLDTGTATTPASRALARSLGFYNDYAGHLIGKQLGGPGGKNSYNIIPQSRSVNRGAFQRWERKIKQHVLSGAEVYITVTPRYHPGSTRPYEIVYEATVNGRILRKVFPNP